MTERKILWTALVTPLTKEGTIDYDSLEVLLRKQEEAGNGILIMGSTGEGLNLLDSEKRELITFTTLQQLEVPVMAGIGGMQLNAQIELMNFADDAGIDAFLLVTPLYAKPGKEGQLAWFSTLMRETSTPCMVYNVPSRTGVAMHPDVPAYLSRTFPNYMGVKEASGSVERFCEFRDNAPKAPLYGGDDILIGDFIDDGAVGLVSVAANAWPKETHMIVDLYLQGKADQVFSEWKESCQLLFRAPNPVPVKTLLQHKGWIAQDQVRLPLSNDDMTQDAEEALLEADRKIHEWAEQF